MGTSLLLVLLLLLLLSLLLVLLSLSLLVLLLLSALCFIINAPVESKTRGQGQTGHYILYIIIYDII